MVLLVPYCFLVVAVFLAAGDDDDECFNSKVMHADGKGDKGSNRKTVTVVVLFYRLLLLPNTCTTTTCPTIWPPNTHTHTHCHLINYYKHHSAQELLLQTLPQQSESAPNLRKQTQPKQNWMSRVRHSVFGKVNEPISPFSCELFGYTTTSFRFWVVSFCPFLVLFSSFACGRFGFSFTLHFSFFPLFFRLSLSFSCFCILKLCCLSFAWPAWWTRVSWCEWDHGHCHKHTHTHTQTTLTSLVVPNQQKL